MSYPIELRAVEAGRAALGVLAGARTARVFAAFERSGYVETANGIACVGVPAIRRGPLNILVRGPLSGLEPGAEIAIEIGSARLWDPSPIEWPDRPVAQTLGRLRGPWSAARPREGLAALFDAPQDVPSRARAAAESLLDWIEEGGREAVPHAARTLIGWGGGLTPAGDDFVGGVLLALRALRRARVRRTLAEWALHAAEEGTSRISRAHLRCAADGHAHEAVWRFVRALGIGFDAAAEALAPLGRLGHTSGWDAAAGVLLISSLTSSRNLAASLRG